MADLWGQMQAQYGDIWVRKFGRALSDDGNEFTDTGRIWCYKLGIFSPQTIFKAMDNLDQHHPDRVPLLGQFIKVCKLFRLPDEAPQRSGAKHCEYTDEQAHQCGNLGTLSTNTAGGGPWDCAHHHFRRGPHAPTDRHRRSWIDEAHDQFIEDHPGLEPIPGEPLGDLRRRNMAFIRPTMTGSVLPDLPYDKDKRIDGAGITREESLRRARESEEEYDGTHPDIPF